MTRFDLFSSSEPRRQAPKPSADVAPTPLPGEPPPDVKARLAHLFRAGTRQGRINPLSYVLAHFHAREHK